MNIRYFLLPVITFFIALNNTIASADSGLVYPPENTLRNYQYPPQAPVTPRLNGMPAISKPYVFGQNNSQIHEPLIPTPKQAQNYGQVPIFPNVTRTNNLPPIIPRNFVGNGINNNSNNFPFSNTNMMPFGNGNNSFNPFSNGNMPFSNKSGGMMPKNPMNNMFGNNQNYNMPFFNSNKNRKKAWGDKRNIWPDFYTDFTDEAWDTMMSSPRDMGRMPGGWRFPYISMPDPVTVSDAITNQFPPIAEEAGNMADISDWGVFDNK